jgi:integrase
MAIYKRGQTYWYKFMWNGVVIRESTKQGNDRKARSIEAAHRTRLAKQEDARNDACSRLKCSEVLLCDECEKWFDAGDSQNSHQHVFCSNSCNFAWKKRHIKVPSLAEFFKLDFLPFVEANLASKSKTAEYYSYGVALLLAADMGGLQLNEITSQHTGAFLARQSRLSPSTQNCGLRTLRRALNLADQWGKIDRAPKLSLATGERQRERIVTESEFLAYRELCRQPWHDVVTVLYGTGMRPGEAYRLRWEHVLLNGTGGMIKIAEGKTKAARRFLPMLPEVYAVLKERHEAQKRPAEGWVFPTASISGHLEESSGKIQHGDALRKLGAASAAYKRWEKAGSAGSWQDAAKAASKLEIDYLTRHSKPIQGGVKVFEPYCLRHSALTRLAENGCDAFTLARIAGHSSITITQRYCHPQADAIERAFGKLVRGHNFRHSQGAPILAGSEAVSTSDCEQGD